MYTTYTGLGINYMIVIIKQSLSLHIEIKLQWKVW